ncbi:MAG: hypothetical protein JG782_727 [Anaerophaga sp.]|nr:hypothetical protein [Anaerophaga sp.]
MNSSTVKEGIPLKQGLRLRSCTNRNSLGVKEGIPLKQGLRPIDEVATGEQQPVKEGIPLKQGLRQEPNMTCDSFHAVSKKVFH